jgi:hypothetical protein
MMPTAQEVADTGIRRAAACSITLHSVCMVVAAKNLKLYPIYRHGIGVKDTLVNLSHKRTDDHCALYIMISPFDERIPIGVR